MYGICVKDSTVQLLADLASLPFPALENLMTEPKVVTFATYLRDGRLCLEHRSFVRADTGGPVNNGGLYTINGGIMDPSETPEEALIREFREEMLGGHHGIIDSMEELAPYCTLIGDVYDKTKDRWNRVWRIDEYDTIVEQVDDPRVLLDILCRNMEGAGIDFVYYDDLMGYIRNTMLTPVTLAILNQYPEMLPPRHSNAVNWGS